MAKQKQPTSRRRRGLYDVPESGLLTEAQPTHAGIGFTCEDRYEETRCTHDWNTNSTSCDEGTWDAYH